ncbi:MAG: GntR family transcriptional regulator [Pseudomonadota bacterium]
MTIEMGGRQRLSSMLAERLTERIMTGELEPGSLLPSERDLCEEFGVGRPTVREAVIHLESRGLLAAGTGKRPRIQLPSLENMLTGISAAAGTFLNTPGGYGHLEQSRMFLETGLVRYAVDHATPAQVGKLHAALDTCELAVGKDQAFRAADVAFHRALAEIPGNPVILVLHDAVVHWLIAQRPVPEDVLAATRASRAEHRNIFQAIVDKQRDQGEDLMVKHLTRAYYLHFLGQEAQSDRNRKAIGET